MRKVLCIAIIGVLSLICCVNVFAEEKTSYFPHRHYLADELVALGMKSYPDSTYISAVRNEKTSAHEVLFTTTDTQAEVISFYNGNMKTLLKHGYKFVTEGTEALRSLGLDPSIGNTLIYTKNNKAVQVQVVPHKNLVGINKIFVRFFKNL